MASGNESRQMFMGTCVEFYCVPGATNSYLTGFVKSRITSSTFSSMNSGSASTAPPLGSLPFGGGALTSLLPLPATGAAWPWKAAKASSLSSFLFQSIKISLNWLRFCQSISIPWSLSLYHAISLPSFTISIASSLLSRSYISSERFPRNSAYFVSFWKYFYACSLSSRPLFKADCVQPSYTCIIKSISLSWRKQN